MNLTHEFSVPATVDETWAAFNHMELIASCLPGASLTSVETLEGGFLNTLRIPLSR